MEIGTQTEHVLRNFDNGDDDGSEPSGELLFDGAEICMVVLGRPAFILAARFSGFKL
jgi:hypothetical protein